MNSSKIRRALLLILGMSIAMSAPSLLFAAESSGSGTTSSSTNDSKKDDKKETTKPSSEKGSGEKSGSGGSEPECN